MSKLLFEILSEEIPARMQADAVKKFEEIVLSTLKTDYGITVNSESWVTPRRMGIHLTDIPLKIDAVTEEIRGPKISAPEAALNGFLNKYGATKDQLELKGDYYSYTHTKPEQNVKEVLKAVLESSMKKLVWPKSMKWADFQETWVRPINSMICIFNKEVIPVTYGDIISSNITKCHRFLDSNKSHQISDFEDYNNKMIKGGVIIDANERKESILRQINFQLKDKNLRLINDDVLLNEIVGLVENPNVFIGSIDSKFMELPKELLIITLKHHQKYLMLEDTKHNLAPHYIIVANINPEDNGNAIISGNNKVLKARLSDAQFFYQNDKRNKLSNNIEKLKKLKFHQDLGSVFDKVQSNIKIGKLLSQYFNADQTKVIRCIELCKADLVSEMVKEFAELQGVMGYYYAINDNEDKEVSEGIRDHYKPVGPNDEIPSNLIGQVAAIADKLDSLNQLFSIGIKPTGSKDPFALRRAANGIIRIVGESNLDSFIDFMKSKSSIRDDVAEYIKERQL